MINETYDTDSMDDNPHDIDTRIANWHSSPDDGQTLLEFLGMSADEYNLWVHHKIKY